MNNIISLIDTFNSLVKENTEFRALVEIYKMLEGECIKGNYGPVNDLFPQIKIEDLPTSILLGVICITAPFDEYLPNKLNYLEDVITHIEQVYSKEEADKLLKGIRLEKN